MLPNIKSYQSETASKRFFTKGSLSIFTNSCHVCLHLHKMLWLYWLDGLEGPLNPHQMDKKESSSVGLGAFAGPLRGEKKLLLEQKI